MMIYQQEIDKVVAKLPDPVAMNEDDWYLYINHFPVMPDEISQMWKVNNNGKLELARNKQLISLSIGFVVQVDSTGHKFWMIENIKTT